MSKVWLTTKGGDRGSTSLYDGTRVAKDDPLVCLYGTWDECQAHVGMARALSQKSEVKERMKILEERLFTLMAVLAHGNVELPDVKELEAMVDDAHAVCDSDFAFVLPGESASGAAFHVARTVARRSERMAVALLREACITEDSFIYMNRFSDCIYALMLWELAEK